jgi:hypothetical protein
MCARLEKSLKGSLAMPRDLWRGRMKRVLEIADQNNWLKIAAVMLAAVSTVISLGIAAYISS